uniref:Uncharacterized protein n=1 Tax=Anguilla anguilla TaxID=7936 RepID=A0A0E9V039_ANGAN
MAMLDFTLLGLNS